MVLAWDNPIKQTYIETAKTKETKVIKDPNNGQTKKILTQGALSSLVIVDPTEEQKKMFA